MDRDYSNCRALELTDHQVSGFVFSWFLENTEKTKASQDTFLRLMPIRDFSKTHAPGCPAGYWNSLLPLFVMRECLWRGWHPAYLQATCSRQPSTVSTAAGGSQRNPGNKAEQLKLQLCIQCQSMGVTILPVTGTQRCCPGEWRPYRRLWSICAPRRHAQERASTDAWCRCLAKQASTKAWRNWPVNQTTSHNTSFRAAVSINFAVNDYCPHKLSEWSRDKWHNNFSLAQL